MEVRRFRPPPGWPRPPQGWVPPPGWAPDPSWPPAPAGWQFWGPVAQAHMTAPVPRIQVPVVPPPATNGFGSRRKALEAENARLRQALANAGALEDSVRAEGIRMMEAQLQNVLAQVSQARAELAAVRDELINAKDVAVLQSAGVYAYAHPLDDAVGYKDRIAKVKEDTKAFVRTGNAVTATTNWQVNGSSSEGKKMVDDFSKLLLRAYNTEADNCVRTVRPQSRQNSVERLTKISETIARLGQSMEIRVDERYHRLRCAEIVLTADHRAKVEAEKEEARLLREEMREQAAAARDYERARAKWDKERAHVESSLGALIRRGDGEGVAALALRSRLEEIEAGRAEVDELAGDARAGHVYVISNVGAFGEGVVKIGMTRRLDPHDRIRELGDASVPFRFDVHAVVQNRDAVGLVRELHARFADRRVNQVDQRREFFRATPAEVLAAFRDIPDAGLVEFTERPDAAEWRSSTM
ncbi:DUF4041 domain-containing protein [Umezawaea tangerina]|uniref:T5orf172 domain-containing protein n=1 Tax=Umezawaea tangerina TaxID=84725 RepID=A0A2T0TAY3_9PSEU|nr:DUF4041 domain-containing protein [Umezawaea tangerina]PRY42821.1 T5orf172 domain-containing protein [Umezawaea tangerina]